MQVETIESLPPSFAVNLLRSLIGKRVMSLTRYSWWPAEDVSSECEIDQKLAFSLTYGPLGVTFEDGTVLGVSEEPSLNSIIVWPDRICDKPIKNPTLDEDEDFFPIGSTDTNFSQNFFEEIIGEVLTDLVVIKMRSMSALLSELPSEIGLVFKFENGSSFIASRGLHEDGGDFSVISYNQILDEMHTNLIEQNLI